MSASRSPEDIDIGHVLLEARTRWLKPVEVCNILQNFRKYEFQLNQEPPAKPPSKGRRPLALGISPLPFPTLPPLPPPHLPPPLLPLWPPLPLPRVLRWIYGSCLFELT
ncbi:unnamed protein product, partial [Closterium sp. Naga37s-1]